MLVASAGCTHEPDRPNVILLVLDTLRRDHLGCYGYPRPTSPNLDRLAADAVVYEQAISAAPWTLPSHATLFTGLLPSNHHAHHEHLKLVDEQITLAERLADAGYETAGFCNNPWITERLGMTQGFQRFDEIWRHEVAEDSFNINIFVDPDVHGMDDAGASRTLEAITGWLEDRDESQPFFLFVNLIEAHTFFDPPAGFRNRFLERSLTRDESRSANLDYMQRAYTDRLDGALIDRMKSLYDAEIAYLDDWIGRFIGLLEHRRLLDRSLLIVTSDHGEAFAEHRLCGIPLIDHQLSVHRELLDVPLVIRYPAGFREGVANGSRIGVPTSATDVVPTVLDVLELDPGQALDGITLARGVPSAERTLISEYYRPIAHIGLLRNAVSDADTLNCLVNRRHVAVQVGQRKLIMRGPNDPLLFDRAVDATERLPQPLETAPEDRALFEVAGETLQAMGRGPQTSPPTIGEAWLEALRSLGYVE